MFLYSRKRPVPVTDTYIFWHPESVLSRELPLYIKIVFRVMFYCLAAAVLFPKRSIQLCELLEIKRKLKETQLNICKRQKRIYTVRHPSSSNALFKVSGLIHAGILPFLRIQFLPQSINHGNSMRGMQWIEAKMLMPR